MDLVINLLPWRERRIDARRRLSLWMLALSLLLAAAGSALVWREHLQVSKTWRREHASLAQAAAQQQQEKQARRQAVAQLQKDAAQRRRQRDYVEKNRRVGELLASLSRHIPAGMWLTRLEYDKEEFVLQGNGADTPELAVFVKRLNQGKERDAPTKVSLETLAFGDDGQMRFTLRGVWGGAA